MRRPEVTDDLATRLKARADDLAIALPPPSDDGNLHAYPILPPAWCRACRADLIAASGTIEAMTAALEEIARVEPMGPGMRWIVHGHSAREIALAALGRVVPPAGADGRGERSEVDA